MRKITAFASAAAVAVAGFVVLPTAIADEVTKPASMSLTCKATPSTIVGPQVFAADDVSVNVTSPEDVEIDRTSIVPLRLVGIPSVLCFVAVILTVAFVPSVDATILALETYPDARRICARALA